MMGKWSYHLTPLKEIKKNNTQWIRSLEKKSLNPINFPKKLPNYSIKMQTWNFSTLLLSWNLVCATLFFEPTNLSF